MIEETLLDLAKEISSRNGLTEKYDIVVSAELEPEQCIVIKGGETPIIYVNLIWVLTLLVETQKVESLRKKKLIMIPLRNALTRAIEKCPRMTRSLSLLTVRDAIELRLHAKRWSETQVPQLKTHLKDRFFHVTYNIAITVSETNTGTSITRHISSLADCSNTVAEAKQAISRSIMESEEMAEIRAIADRIEDAKSKPVNPYSIEIKAEGNNLTEKMVY